MKYGSIKTVFIFIHSNLNLIRFHLQLQLYFNSAFSLTEVTIIFSLPNLKYSSLKIATKKASSIIEEALN